MKPKADGASDSTVTVDGRSDGAGDLAQGEAGGDGPLTPDGLAIDGKAGDGAPRLDLAVDAVGADLADRGAPDAPPSCTAFSGTIGTPCSATKPCGSGYTCLDTGSAGFCTVSCTPDDPKTSANEDTCPTAKFCAPVLTTSGTTKNYCFHPCRPIIGCSECPSGAACNMRFAKSKGFAGRAVCMGSGCSKNSDCPVTTGQTCDTAKKNCATGQTCLPVVSGKTVGMCARDGVCDLKSGLCDKHALGKSTAKVGDPCGGDTDCGDTMFCLSQWDERFFLKAAGQSCQRGSQCCSGVCTSGLCSFDRACLMRYRNGYCTIKNCQYSNTLGRAICPSGSSCNLWYTGGLCQKECDLKSSTGCRNYSGDLLGDYECRAWDRLMYDTSTTLSKKPVCDFGFALPCSTWASSSLTCADVGLHSNPTNMQCRDLNNTKLSTGSARGFCLDDTPSGKTGYQFADGTFPKLDGGMADSATAPDLPRPDLLQPDQQQPDLLPPDKGAPLTGFGTKCTTSCPSGLTCYKESAASTEGFCTKQCNSLGQLCSGTTTGQMALCDIQVGTLSYCRFLCDFAGTAFTCPSGLGCAAAWPPGSSTRYCKPGVAADMGGPDMAASPDQGPALDLGTAANNTCKKATTLTFGTAGLAFASGATTTATNTVSLKAAGCTNKSTGGPDVFYAISLVKGKTYYFLLTPDSAFDAALYIFTTCGQVAKTCVAGSDAQRKGGVEVLTITAKQTGVHYIGVDSNLSAGTGTFQLQIT